MAGSKDEEIVAVALDGDGYLIEELVGKNTGHGFGLQEPARVLRPLIKAGASAFVFVVANVREGKPRATPDLCRFAERLQEAGNAVGIVLHDVVIVGGRDHGWINLAQRGLITT